MNSYDPNKTYVLAHNDWCVSTQYPVYNNETHEVINKHELHIFSWQGRKLIKHKSYGMLFDSSEEAREYAFNLGFLKEYNHG